MESFIWMLDNLATAGLLMLAFATLLLASALRRSRLQQRQTEAEVERLNRDVRSLSQGAVGVGRRLATMEGEWRNTTERQEQLEQDSRVPSYAHATRLARGGGGVDDILATCDFSQAEAELLVKMQRLNSAN